MKAAARLEMVRLEHVVGAEVNPKAHDLGELMASIKRFGFVDFPTRNETTGRLVEGHGRIEALRLMKDAGEAPPKNVVSRAKSWFVPVVCGLSWANDDEAQVYLLAHNQMPIASGWERSLARVLSELRSRDVPVLGWRDAEIAKMLAQVRAHDRAIARDTAPPPPQAPVSKPGDLWQLGDHLLYCGSCEDLPGVMGDRRAQLLVTDPPYGVDYGAKNAALNAMDGGARIETTIESDDLTPEQIAALWLQWFTPVRALLAPGAAWYVTGPAGDLLLLLLLSLQQAGFSLRQMCVWAKNKMVFGRRDYHQQHESIFYGWLEGAGHHRVDNRSETTLWAIDSPTESKLHPTMKPVELYRRAIRNSSDAGDTVLELFSGSGTCIVACEELGRRCVAAELSPAYVDVGVKRWEDMTGTKAVLLPRIPSQEKSA